MTTTPSVPDGTASLRTRVVRIIFLSLLMDLLAFTMPLPLFPRLIASFVEAESGKTETTLLSWTLQSIRACRTAMTSWRSADLSPRLQPSNSKWDITILGGILGSIFSFCQFLVSPVIGRLSDTYGRKPILLMTMVGNILSAIIWLGSTRFGPYVVSRAVGGLSEGNVQLSIAVISDVSDPTTRAKSLALVGIAFSVCFTLGPILGAWFAMRSPPLQAAQLLGVGLNIYALPALISLLLLVFETLYLAIALPETKHLQISPTPRPLQSSKSSSASHPSSPPLSLQDRQRRMRILARIHTLFLFFFSGAEFTLTFLTYDLYGFTNGQNGGLLGFIGILSSIVQGGYIRRSSRAPEWFVETGILGSVAAQVLLSILPGVAAGGLDKVGGAVLYSAAAGLAYVSGAVVNSLNTLASLECDAAAPGLARGSALGAFRSAGQLGRALGPLFVTALYWAHGPAICYRICALGSLAVWLLARRFASQTHTLPAKKTR